MINHRIFSPALLLLGTFIAAMQPACAAEMPAHLTMGPPDGPRVEVTIERHGHAASAVVIETHQAGVPGSLLRLSVDSQKPFLSAILTDHDCRFADRGSICTIRYPQGSQDFRSSIGAFRNGRVAHVEITNAGNLSMAHSVSLTSFSRALARLSTPQRYR